MDWFDVLNARAVREMRVQKNPQRGGLFEVNYLQALYSIIRSIQDNLCKVNTNVQKSVAICSDHINKLSPSQILLPRDAPPRRVSTSIS
jgi:hypothetical protein